MADWSHAEVETTVADYFEMLEAERSGLPYSKAQHRKALLKLLDKRTEAAI